jgi:hypothetical protein
MPTAKEVAVIAAVVVGVNLFLKYVAPRIPVVDQLAAAAR